MTPFKRDFGDRREAANKKKSRAMWFLPFLFLSAALVLYLLPAD